MQIYAKGLNVFLP